MAAVKAAIVTGASRGIGLTIAARLAKAGYRVALFGRDNAKLSEAVGICAAAADGECWVSPRVGWGRSGGSLREAGYLLDAPSREVLPASASFARSY